MSAYTVQNPFLKPDRFPYMIIHEGKHGNCHWLINRAEDVDKAVSAYFDIIRDYYIESDHEALKKAQERYGDSLGLALIVQKRSSYEYERVYVEYFDKF